MSLRAQLSLMVRHTLAHGLLVAGAALVLEVFSRLVLVAREGAISLPASLTLLAIAALLQSACAAAVAPAAMLARVPRWLRLLCLAVLFGVPVWWAFAPVAIDLTSGEWIRKQSYARTLRMGLVWGAAAGAVLLAWLSYLPRRFPRARILALVGLSLTAQALHTQLFPGQYELLHLALWVSAALLLAMAASIASAVYWPFPSFRHTALGALAWLAMAGLALSVLPVQPRVTGTLAHRSLRTGMLFGRVLPRSVDDVLYEYLRTLDLTRPLRHERAQASGRLRLPANFNVIFVVVDTLRADTLEPARSQGLSTRFDGRNTPFLDRLMQRSLRFRRAYAQGTMTHLSMPPLFRSRQPYDREVDRGHALAELMKKLGRKPLAVVPQYFPERKRDLPIGDLLVGFDDVAIYKRDAQNEQRRMIEARLEAAKDTPFFAWLHYYAMHVPGWDGQRIPLNQPAWPANYQRPLKWVDGQIHALFDKLKALGIDRRTMVVFTSDHGEGLLDNGMLTHGGSLAEVAVRVPLAFYIPGQKPRVIEHTVGNIDIVPTLHDLLGGDAHPEYAGRSLVPLFTDPRGAWSRSYFTVAGRQKGISLVRGTHKHVMDRTANVHFHFDLESDPREEHDLFDPGKRDHLTLLHEVVAAVPGWFATEHAKRWDKLFRRRLEEVNPRRPPEALPTLLKLIHAARAKKYLVPVQRWYREAVDDRVRVLILREVFRRDPKGFTELLVEQLTPIADTPRAAAFVEELSGYEGPYRAAQKVLNDARTARPAPLAPP